MNDEQKKQDCNDKPEKKERDDTPRVDCSGKSDECKEMYCRLGFICENCDN